MNADENRSCVNRAASICVALVVGVCGLFGAVIPGNAAKSSTEAYLDRLHGQGKERVIVRFKDDAKVDASLVGKHGGKLIRNFSSNGRRPFVPWWKSGFAEGGGLWNDGGMAKRKNVAAVALGRLGGLKGGESESR